VEIKRKNKRLERKEMERKSKNVRWRGREGMRGVENEKE
jgi:hypothetical protein